MKFFIAIALFAAVASARILPANVDLTPVEAAEVEQILAAIHSPSTDPTTAVMLEQMLLDLLGLAPVQTPVHVPAVVDQFEPIHVGPAIVDQFEPIHVGPALIDFPLPEGALEATPVAPAPEAPAAPAPSTAPLVQIIVNVKQQDGVASPVQVDNVQASPIVVVDKPEIQPTPVMVVEEAFQPAPTPVAVVEEAVVAQPEQVIVVDQPFVSQPEPVIVVDQAFESAPTPVIVVDQAFLPQPEPVIVSPIIAAPVVAGPAILN